MRCRKNVVIVHNIGISECNYRDVMARIITKLSTREGVTACRPLCHSMIARIIIFVNGTETS